MAAYSEAFEQQLLQQGSQLEAGEISYRHKGENGAMYKVKITKERPRDSKDKSLPKRMKKWLPKRKKSDKKNKSDSRESITSTDYLTIQPYTEPIYATPYEQCTVSREQFRDESSEYINHRPMPKLPPVSKTDDMHLNFSENPSQTSFNDRPQFPPPTCEDEPEINDIFRSSCLTKLDCGDSDHSQIEHSYISMSSAKVQPIPSQIRSKNDVSRKATTGQDFKDESPELLSKQSTKYMTMDPVSIIKQRRGNMESLSIDADDETPYVQSTVGQERFCDELSEYIYRPISQLPPVSETDDIHPDLAENLLPRTSFDDRPEHSLPTCEDEPEINDTYSSSCLTEVGYGDSDDSDIEYSYVSDAEDQSKPSQINSQKDVNEYGEIYESANSTTHQDFKTEDPDLLSKQPSDGGPKDSESMVKECNANIESHTMDADDAERDKICMGRFSLSISFDSNQHIDRQIQISQISMTKTKDDSIDLALSLHQRKTKFCESASNTTTGHRHYVDQNISSVTRHETIKASTSTLLSKPRVHLNIDIYPTPKELTTDEENDDKLKTDELLFETCHGSSFKSFTSKQSVSSEDSLSVNSDEDRKNYLRNFYKELQIHNQELSTNDETYAEAYDHFMPGNEAEDEGTIRSFDGSVNESFESDVAYDRMAYLTNLYEDIRKKSGNYCTWSSNSAPNTDYENTLSVCENKTETKDGQNEQGFLFVPEEKLETK